jgi:hypothetical protein
LGLSLQEFLLHLLYPVHTFFRYFCDGKIYGIELLNANEQLKPQDNELVFTDTVTGKITKIPIGIN